MPRWRLRRGDSLTKDEAQRGRPEDGEPGKVEVILDGEGKLSDLPSDDSHDCPGQAPVRNIMTAAVMIREVPGGVMGAGTL